MAFVPPAGCRSIRIRNDFPPILLEIAMPSTLPLVGVVAMPERS
jgi:hypothetical protein